MALEFICSNEIICGEKIFIPVDRGANFYKTISGKIKFFYVNPYPEKKMKKIPTRAVALSFNDYHRLAYSIDYGEPTFCDKGGNILKDCNGIRLWTKQ